MLTAVVLPWLWGDQTAWLPLVALGAYLLAVLIGSGIKSGSIKAALLAPIALLVQFTGYGLGFLKSTFLLTFSNKEPEKLLPKLFFHP